MNWELTFLQMHGGQYRFSFCVYSNEFHTYKKGKMIRIVLNDNEMLNVSFPDVSGRKTMICDMNKHFCYTIVNVSLQCLQVPIGTCPHGAPPRKLINVLRPSGESMTLSNFYQIFCTHILHFVGKHNTNLYCNFCVLNALAFS